MTETRGASSSTVRDFDDAALGEILERIAGGSTGYFAGTAPAAVQAAVERIRTLAIGRGIELSVSVEGDFVVVRAMPDVGHELPYDITHAA